MTEQKMESVDAFRERARGWIEANIPATDGTPLAMGRERVERAQELQKKIFDAGFAGLTWPKEFGGQELTPAHMHAFIEELSGYENPYTMLSVSLGVVGPTILEHGTQEQKARYLPDLLRGDTLWVQFLSEPSAGSDMAGVLTRAVRDGDDWILNGSKVWTTFGHYADYALCLARNDWDAQKHRGLSMFIVPIDAPGVTVSPLVQASGASEFCQEFLEDVRIPADHLVGAENAGWALASALLMHERTALGGGSVYFASEHHDDGGGDEKNELAQLAARVGLADDAHIRQLVAECHALSTVSGQLATRVATGMRAGALPGPAGSMLKLFTADLHLHRTQLNIELSGSTAAAWPEDDGTTHEYAMDWLARQGTSIMGGTNEIQRNIISERVLGMPREATPDKDIPFNQVRTNSEKGS
jgi:alkylation response protein AidB-like acyl-CoA dehydrogenase